jgi:hypothetical protein
MPSGRTSPEADAADAAFMQRVQILYQTLATNLGDSPGSERKGVQAFKKGLSIARRARELALEAIEATNCGCPRGYYGSESYRQTSQVERRAQEGLAIKPIGPA